MFDLREVYKALADSCDPGDPSACIAYAPPESEAVFNVGIVEDNKDPDKLGRLKVKLVTLAKDAMSHWVPLIRPFASADSGFFILPDKGEQVIVAHIGGSASRFVVIGSAYTPRDGIDPGENEKNARKFYLSRSGSRITFDDTCGKETLTISVKEGKMFLSLGPKGLVLFNDLGDIEIKTKKKLAIEAGEIAMRTKKCIEFKTSGDASIKCSKGIKLKAGSGTDCVLKGRKIKLKGNSGVTACGKQIAKDGDQVIGLDIHSVSVPAPPGPNITLPLPHPFIGKLKDQLSSDVEIGGKKAATKGSKAKHLSPGHILTPPGVSFNNAPRNEAEVDMNTCPSVKINGKEACVIGSQATSCNDIGLKFNSNVIAAGAAAVIPIKLAGIDDRTYREAGGFVVNTRNIVSNEPAQDSDKKPKLSSPKWGSSKGKAGEEVTLSVSSSDLHANATVYFEIWAEGANKETDEPVQKLTAPNKGGKAEAVWTWFYRSEDWPEPFEKKPGFTFTADAFKCERVESGRVEMGQDVKIEMNDIEGRGLNNIKYALLRADEKIEGGVSNGKIVKPDMIPGQYTLKIIQDGEN